MRSTGAGCCGRFRRLRSCPCSIHEGREQLRISRQAMDEVGSNTDYSMEEKFKAALANKVYYGPVYFRRGTEPFMTLAMAGARRDAGVSVAEVNLTHIWDVVNQIRVGRNGRAYVVDAQGRLIAHPEISLVLRNTDSRSSPRSGRHARRRNAPDLEEAEIARDAEASACWRRTRRLPAQVAGAGGAARARSQRAALHGNRAHRRGSAGRARSGAARGAAACAPDGRSRASAGRRSGAHRRRRSRSPHHDQVGRRVRSIGRAVERHGGQAAELLRDARAQGRGAHRSSCKRPIFPSRASSRRRVTICASRCTP